MEDNALVSFALATLFFGVGIQIYGKDLLLRTGIYHYRTRLPQIITYVAGAVVLYVSICHPVITASAFSWIDLGIFTVVAYIGSFAFEWTLAKINWQNRFLTVAVRLVEIALLAIVQWEYHQAIYALPFIVAGYYLRNCKFGVVHGKDFVIASYMPSRNVKKLAGKAKKRKEFNRFMPELPNFSNAGQRNDFGEDFPRFNVCDFGATPDAAGDQTEAIQKAIDKAGTSGGGIVFFPKGKYRFRKGFLQINYSNIILEGETGKDGKLLAELILCHNLVSGKRNPWLSPFLITTGESLQRSNIFFGLQFRKRKETFTQSTSLSDPGSDGNILTPEFATNVIGTSHKGETLLHVEDASKLSKFIMLGLYNTTEDGNLLKDILGLDLFREEWQTALRAGPERAPSYQWLIEVKRVIDEHTVELVQPLWRDCDMLYEPAVFNVPMLENIGLRNLKLNSTWNGLFRHHGHRRYYTVAQTQEMDYGWNAVNMKRVANGFVKNVEFHNFTNPLYVMDSRNISATQLRFDGYDGHQGIKVYEHACDNLFQDIEFRSHYADMMGGEGNAYGNVFSRVQYVNPVFKPVDYDFHGFSEGPMSPPSHNLFELVSGFALIHCGGSNHMHPSFAQNNVWWNCCAEGELKKSFIFRTRYNKKQYTPKDQCKLFRNSHFYGTVGAYDQKALDPEFIRGDSWGTPVKPDSLYLNQKERF